ncbi:MAG TPA: TIR domain-containing protein [Myxococcota bacterium]|nr:TIR domain-containing protein [Myxococcota bacterium]
MPRPNVFVCHRWKYNDDYYKLVGKFSEYGFPVVNYSVPEHDPLDWVGIRRTYDQLAEQVRQCNYFIVFGRMATDTEWCRHEVGVAVEYRKPILAVTPRGYVGGVPRFIAEADNQGGPITFHTPAIIERIKRQLAWP